MHYYKKDVETAYEPRKGCMTENIERCLSTTVPKTAEQIHEESGVPLRRVQDHLRYWVARGRLEEVA